MPNDGAHQSSARSAPSSSSTGCDIVEHQQFDGAVRGQLFLGTAFTCGQEVIRIDHTYDARALATVGQDAVAVALSRAGTPSGGCC